MKKIKTGKRGKSLEYEFFANESSYRSPKSIDIEQRRMLREATRELLHENVFKHFSTRK